MKSQNTVSAGVNHACMHILCVGNTHKDMNRKCILGVLYTNIPLDRRGISLSKLPALSNQPTWKKKV